MSARILKITGKRIRDRLAVVKLGDFRLREAGTLDTAEALRDPRLSLYCLDGPRRRAVYVRTPDSVDLTREPFIWRAQRLHAEELVAIDLDELDELADGMEDPGDRITLLYSVGRCGSTLLSRAFDQAGCLSLSEPDVYTQLLSWEMSPEQGPLRLRRLTRVLLGRRGPRPVHLVLKFRSMCMEQAGMMHAAFPEARMLFLYRDAEAVVRSGMGAFCRFGSNLWLLHHFSRWAPLRPLLRSQLPRRLKMMRHWSPCVDLYDTHEWSRMGAVGMLAVMWLSAMARCLALHEERLPWTTLRYEDLIESPERILAQVFQACGLPASRVADAQRALLEDSQKGSMVARTTVRRWTLRAADRRTIAGALARHPRIRTPGFILPGTLRA